MEVIEIGAVMLDDNYNEIAAFKTYVKPEYNEVIERKIYNLTGISMDMLQDAPGFDVAFKMFTDWCLGIDDDIILYAWSNTDYAQIISEIKAKNYKVTEKESQIVDKEWRDFRDEFDRHLGFAKCLKLSTALDMAGIEIKGNEHDALDDARNTAELLQVFKDIKLFNLTLEKIKEAMQTKPLEVSLVI